MRTAAFPDKTGRQGELRLSSSAAGQNAQRLQNRQLWLVIGGRILLFAILICVWQLISGPLINPLFISSPSAIFAQLIAWIADGTLWFHTWITLEETLLGLLFGVIAGVIAGFLFGLQEILAKILDPFIVALYSIPKVAVAPLFIIWFGIDIQMKVILASVTVFFLVFFNTLAGVRNVDQDLIDAVRLMGGKGRDLIWKVVVPSAIGYTLTGVHIAIPYALVGAVVAELIASNRGLGFLIDSSATSFQTAGVLTAVLMLTVIAGLLNAFVNIVDRLTSRWKVGTQHIGRKILR